MSAKSDHRVFGGSNKLPSGDSGKASKGSNHCVAGGGNSTPKGAGGMASKGSNHHTPTPRVSG